MHAPAPVNVRRLWIRRFSLALVVALSIPALPVLAQPNGPDADMSVEELFNDFLHFARLGKFELADAYANQLLGHPDLDPVGLLAVADRDPDSMEMLMLIISNSDISDNAAKVVEVIRRGEFELRQDVGRIKENISKLGGPPQMEYEAVQRLIESGEYAVPWMLQTLRDQAQEKLHARVLAALPKIGRAAVNPLVAALETGDQVLVGHIIRTLGRTGYAQALPYLQKVLLSQQASEATKSAAAAAIQEIGGASVAGIGASPVAGFVRLGEQYYEEQGSVQADPRLASANVWYWDADADFLKAVPVPQRIFGSVMAMRCCQEALSIEPGSDDAIALWLAANIRREARLGLDVESPEPGQPTEADDTRPADFPPSLYFTRAAGARYAHLVLQRAVRDQDSAVALGAIAALRAVAGESSLIGTADYQQPLVHALKFPDRVVRLRAALALGNALPKATFAGAELTVPVLAGALSPVATRRFVVVDGDSANLNRVAGVLRESAQVIAEPNFYQAMDKARAEFDGVTAFLLATDIAAPTVGTAVEALGREFAYQSTPVILLVQAHESQTARDLGAGSGRLDQMDAAADLDGLPNLLASVQGRTGQTAVDSTLALELALESAATLRRIAVSGSTVFSCAVAEPALVGALGADDEELRVRCASVLALIDTATAQRAIADVALDAGSGDSLRLAALAALSESAKVHGNRLDAPRVDRLIEAARGETDLVMRTAASQALGALNLADNKASEIIRSYFRG